MERDRLEAEIDVLTDRLVQRKAMEICLSLHFDPENEVESAAYADVLMRIAERLVKCADDVRARGGARRQS